MYHYTINGKLIILEGMTSDSLDKNVSKILENSEEKIKQVLDDHKKDLLKNINIKDDKIGFGITDPTHKLTIKSDSWLDNFRIIGTKKEGSGITFTNNLDNSGYIYYGGSESKIGEGSIGFATSEKKDTKMVIKNNGKVGIGTNPLYKLHLSEGENLPTGLALSKSGEWGNSKIEYKPQTNRYINHISIGFDQGSNALGKTNISDGLTVTREGNVGIKTNNPLSNLHIKNKLKGNTILGLSGEKDKNMGIIFDKTGKHTLNKLNSGILLEKKDMIIRNANTDNNLILSTGGQDNLTISKNGEVSIKNKLKLNSQTFILYENEWKSGGYYTFKHNSNYLPAFIKIYFQFTKNIGDIFLKNRFYEITNVNDTSDWPYQRGTFLTFDANNIYLRIAPYGPMILNLYGKVKKYSDIKPRHGNIIIKVFALE